MLGQIFDWEKMNSFFSCVFEFIVINLLFLLCNLPLLVFIFGIGIQKIGEFLPVFLGCTVLLGPALCAVFHCMQKRITNKGIYPWRDFWRGYKKNFVQSFLASLIQNTLVFILVTNIQFCKEQSALEPFVFIFVVLLVLVILTVPVTYLLIAKFRMSPMELIRASIAITIGKPGLTLGNTAAFLLMLAFFEISAGTAILCISSVYGFLVVFMSRKTIDSLVTVQG